VSPPYFETGHPYEHDQFISLMGESWAVRALAAALGPANKSSIVLREAEPVAIEPWVETVLFGSSSDVQKLLASGFDPNTTTKVGSLSALMCAAPDVEKMQLLISHGANVDFRSRDRFNALLVAANYPGSEPAMNLLLDHGATVRLPKGQGAPLFNANPLMLAALSSNAGIIARLAREGSRASEQMNVIGMIPASPLIFLATSHRTDSVGALLDAGASVNELDGDRITPLSWAVISNRVEMARLLIERGADVNHMDRFGMTPLLYAASIDFGDEKMIRLLRASGANSTAKTPQGLTAVDLARKYQHTHLLAALE
jgi:ankyrin repeat protein